MDAEIKLSVEELYQDMSKNEQGGYINLEEGNALREEIEKVPSGGCYLEIGVAFGQSLATVAYYAKPDVGIFGIDIVNWEQRDTNLHRLGLLERVKFIEGDSQQIALDWQRYPIDLLFIDGDHSYYGITKDLLSWLPYVKSGGRILLHDFSNTSPGVIRAVHEFIYPHKAYENFDNVMSLYRFTKK